MIGQDPLEQLANPGIMGGQQPLAGDERYLGHITLQLGQAVLRRKRELDPPSATADHDEAQPRYFAGARQQRLPPGGKPVDRLD